MAIKTTKFDVLDHLKTPAEQIAYFEAALDADDPSFLATALGDIARAQGVTKFAKTTGLSREAIYKGLKPGGNPTIGTIHKATRALGMKLVLAPAKPDKKPARRTSAVA